MQKNEAPHYWATESNQTENLNNTHIINFLEIYTWKMFISISLVIAPDLVSLMVITVQALGIMFQIILIHLIKV